MEAFLYRSGWWRIALVAGLIQAGAGFVQTAFAQNAATSLSVSGSSGNVSAYQQEQQTLSQELQALMSQGATPQQLAAWRSQNAAQLQAQQQLAQSLAVASALRPMPANLPATIPANATGVLKDFLTTRILLANARAQIHNQLLQALPSGATQAQLDSMQQQEDKLLQQQDGADIQLQAQRAQALGAQSASIPEPTPGPPVIPPNASPQLQAFLTLRATLVGSMIQLRNQYLGADPATRAAAIGQWRQQNAASISQLNQLAQTLSNSANSTSTQGGTNP